MLLSALASRNRVCEESWLFFLCRVVEGVLKLKGSTKTDLVELLLSLEFSIPSAGQRLAIKMKVSSVGCSHIFHESRRVLT